MSGGRFEIPDDGDSGFVLDGELDEELPRILREPVSSPVSSSASSSASGPMAEGRIGPGHVTYDDVRQEYLAMDPSEVRDRHRPVGEWSALDREMDAVVDWTDRRIGAQDRLRKDNFYKFLTTYSSMRSKELSRLQIGTASRPGAFRREEEGNLRWMQSGPQVLERAEIAPSIGGGPSPLPRGVDPPGVSGVGPPGVRGSVPSVLGPVRVVQLPGESQSEARERVIMQEQREAQEREASHRGERMAERERLTRISGWLERPEIIGVQGLSSEVYGNIEKAYVYVTNNMPQFEGVKDLNVFPNTDVTSVRNLFAQLTANLANYTDFLILPVTSLEKTGGRLMIERKEILYQLNQWSYDANRDEFERRSLDDMRREADSMMALPSASSFDRTRSHSLDRGWGY